MTVNGSTSITVAWMAPSIHNGNIIRYELTVSSTSPSAPGQGEFNLSNTSLEYAATMLSPFTSYTFELAAVTGAGRGASVIATDTTDEDGMSKLPWFPIHPVFSPTHLAITHPFN